MTRQRFYCKTEKCAKIATYGLVDAVSYTLPDSID